MSGGNGGFAVVVIAHSEELFQDPTLEVVTHEVPRQCPRMEVSWR